MQDFVLECFIELVAEASSIGLTDLILELMIEELEFCTVVNDVRPKS